MKLALVVALSLATSAATAADPQRQVPLLCIPTTGATADAQQALPLEGVVRHAKGRETPPYKHQYVCPVTKPAAAGAPLTRLSLSYVQASPNGVGQATLELRVKYTGGQAGDPPAGSTASLGRVQSTPGDGYRSATALLGAPIDFTKGHYWLVLTMSTDDLPIDVHEVALLP